MAGVEDILKDNAFFNDVIDTPKEGIEQHKKREELSSIIDKGKIGHKWTYKRVEKEAMTLLIKRTLNTSTVN